MRLFPIFAAACVISSAAPAFALSAVAQSGVDCMAANAPLNATVERATFRSRGREVQGLLYRPIRPNGAGVVLLHDRDGIHEDLSRYEAQVGRLASCGYAVIVPSYYDAAGPRSVNDPMLADKWTQVIDEAINQLGRVEGVDVSRVGVWGHGRGGGLALADATNGIAAQAIVMVSSIGRSERPRTDLPVLVIAGDRNPDAPLFAAEQFARDMRRVGWTDITVQSVPSSAVEFDVAAWDAVFEQTKSYFDRKLGVTR